MFDLAYLLDLSVPGVLPVIPSTGAGLFPAGLFPGGYGAPATVAATPASPLPDPSTGLSLTGRFINPQTNDFVMQADGRLQGMPTVAQLVLIAIKDIDLSPLSEKGKNFKQALASLVSGALSQLVAQKLVRIKQVTVLEPTKDSGFANVDWIDLTNGAPQQTPIGS